MEIRGCVETATLTHVGLLNTRYSRLFWLSIDHLLFFEDFLHAYISTTPDATTGILSITRLVFKFRVRGIDQSQRAKIYGGANLASIFYFPVWQHITTTFPLPKPWLPFPNIHDAAPKHAEQLTIEQHLFLSINFWDKRLCSDGIYQVDANE
jgi:hypothetical protein